MSLLCSRKYTYWLPGRNLVKMHASVPYGFELHIFHVRAILNQKGAKKFGVPNSRLFLKNAIF